MEGVLTYMEKSKLIKKGELITLYPGMIYYIYESKDGLIWGETLSAPFFQIAETFEEYQKLSLEKLENKIYSEEMSVAR